MDTSTINIAERVKDARRDAKLTQTSSERELGNLNSGYPNWSVEILN